MNNYSVSISIVTYNNEKYIGQLLDSICHHTMGVAYHVFVVDNGSVDRSVEIVKSMDDPRITLIQNGKNIGFGSAHNIALKVAQSKYHFFVNPDIILKEDIISHMSQYLDDQEDIGALTPKVLYPDGRLQLLPKKNPKCIYFLARRVNLRFLNRYRKEYEMLPMGVDNIFDIEFCTGSFLAARTDLLKRIGGFDERYFMYFEDADLTREICKHARAVYNPEFVVYHHWERAGNKQFKYFCIQIQSMLRYGAKWRRDKK